MCCDSPNLHQRKKKSALNGTKLVIYFNYHHLTRYAIRHKQKLLTKYSTHDDIKDGFCVGFLACP